LGAFELEGVYTQTLSLIKINNLPYLLEITIEGGSLYHSYARPFRNAQDCLISLEAIGEFPLLPSEVLPVVEPLTEVVADEVGNLMVHSKLGFVFKLIKYK
jgi:hypothetical protein